MLRFAYSTINWGETPDLPEMFRSIAETGWDAVELFAHSLDWLGSPNRLRRDLGDLQAATMFGVIELPADRIRLGKLRRQIDYAAEIGAEAYGLVGGSRLRWRPPAPEEYDELARACEELARHGAEQGVAVAYHPHVACTIETEEEIDRLLNATQALTLCLDASHIALVGEDPIAHLRKYRDRTSYVHLKDWAKGKFVELGQGTLGIDFPAILRELDAMAFPGWVVIEMSRSDVSPAVSARANAAYLQSLGYTLTARSLAR
ncbi:MAG: hypothetical protein C4346_00670 [Chloroflexota bacterium]